MKKKNTTLILLGIFSIGLFILLYPMISQYWNSTRQSRAVNSYENKLQKISTQDYQKMFDEAYSYNEKLSKLQFPLVQYSSLDNYQNILDINGNGMIGYVAIPKIKIELPIYHGTSAAVLNVAAGHLEGSSLPVGGNGTHAIISAHRGLPSSKLFTDLNKLEEGDTFTITVLDKTFTYQVDKISVIKPSEITELVSVPGKDYVTLMTCTPYGINTHRLLVRGKRVETDNQKQVYVKSEAYLIDRLIITSIISLIIIIGLMIYIFVKPVKRENIKEVIK